MVRLVKAAARVFDFSTRALRACVSSAVKVCGIGVHFLSQCVCVRAACCKVLRCGGTVSSKPKNCFLRPRRKKQKSARSKFFTAATRRKSVAPKGLKRSQTTIRGTERQSLCQLIIQLVDLLFQPRDGRSRFLAVSDKNTCTVLYMFF